MWKFSGFRQDDESQNHVHCKQCFAIVADPQGKPTNLYNYVKHHQKPQYDEAVKAKKTEKPSRTTKQTSITGTLYSVSPYLSSSHRHKAITEVITYHLTNDMANINTVQNKGNDQHPR